MLLYQLHDRARDAGIEGYRRMSKVELAEALEIELEGQDQPAAEVSPASPRASGPTEVDVARRNGFAVVTLRGHDNALGPGYARAAGNGVRGVAARTPTCV